jgi:hypothetical protein
MEMKLMLAAMAVAAIALPTLSVEAAGPYDGTWTFEAPPVAGGSGDPYDLNSCAAIRFQVDVRDNAIVGNLRMTPYSGGTGTAGGVTSSPGRGSSPVQGTVQPDGTLNAQWERFKATGKLGAKDGQLSWRGQCGPRTAKGVKEG